MTLRGATRLICAGMLVGAAALAWTALRDRGPVVRLDAQEQAPSSGRSRSRPRSTRSSPAGSKWTRTTWCG